MGAVKKEVFFRSLNDIIPELKAKAEPETAGQSDIEILLKDRKPSNDLIAEAWIRWTDFGFMYNPILNQWHNWNGSFWQTDKTLEAGSSLTDYAKHLRGIKTNERTQDLLIDIARYIVNKNNPKNILEIASYKVKQSDFNSDPELLNFINGTLNIFTLEFREHRKEDYISYSLPFDYEPARDCPTWNNFLEEVIRDHDLNTDYKTIMYLQKFAGYCLTNAVSEQVFLFFYGKGQNGKSRIVETIHNLLGGEDCFSVQIVSQYLKDNKHNNDLLMRELIRTKGKRITFGTELNNGMIPDEAVLKLFTGGEKITARRIREESETFKITSKLILEGNYKPQIKGTDKGIKRRFLMIPFLYTIPDENIDRDLQNKLNSELTGIMNWTLAGLRLWKSEGLKDIPETIKTATAEYFDELDIIQDFINTKCDIEQGTATATKELFSAFAEYLREAGEKGNFTQRQLTTHLQNKDYKVIVGHGNKRLIEGLKLKTSEELSFEEGR